MKTQKEIGNSKNEISEKIQNLSTEIRKSNDLTDIEYKADRSRQLQAQYNILLEVLK